MRGIVLSESADVYDLLYTTVKDYAAESARIAELIRERAPGARSLLDVACGTGRHARWLAERHGFYVDGLDLQPDFVRIAQRNLPAGRVVQADMTSFDLERHYDAIICLFSAIGYVRTLENVTRTLARFRAHLADGGVVIVEPWFPPGVLQPGRIFATCAEREGLAVCRMGRTEVDGRTSRLHFEYLIGRGGIIERASETHELGLFTTDEMAGCFRAAGFVPEHDPVGIDQRGLFIASIGRNASTETGAAPTRGRTS